MSAPIVPHIRPRSVPDATRFTPSTPHTIQFSSAKASAPRSPNPRFVPPNRPPTGGPPGRRNGPGNGQGRGASAAAADPARFTETPDQKVARLREMHRRAVDAARDSRLDRILDRGRVVCDALHRGTLYFLWASSVVAFSAAVYSAVDMYRHTRARKAEFFAIQKQLEDESVDAARLAYMTNTATPEQIALIEEVDLIEKRRAEGKPISSLFMPKVPDLLSLSEKTEAEKEEDRVRAKLRTVGSMAAAHWRGTSGLDQAADAAGGPGARAGAEAEADAVAPATTTRDQQAGLKQDAAGGGGGMWSWITGLPSTTFISQPAAATAAVAETASATAAGVTESVREKARVAFEKEKENERVGDPLDRTGMNADADAVAAQAAPTPTESVEPVAPATDDKPKKKGWW